jgi:hypothetical protein
MRVSEVFDGQCAARIFLSRGQEYNTQSRTGLSLGRYLQGKKNNKQNMMKFNLLIAIYFLSIFLINGQNIKEFYIPSDDESKELLYTMAATKSFEIEIHFIKNDDNTYTRIEKTKFKGSVINNEIMTIKFSDNCIMLIEDDYSSTITNGTHKKQKNPVPLMKIPVVGQKITWTYMPLNTTYKCTSEWTTVKMDIMEHIDPLKLRI